MKRGAAKQEPSSTRRKTSANKRDARLRRAQALAALEKAQAEMALIHATGPEIVGTGPVPPVVAKAADRVRQLFMDRTALSYTTWLSTHTLSKVQTGTTGTASHQRRIVQNFLRAILRDDDVVMTPTSLTLTGRDAVPTSTMQVSIQKSGFSNDVWRDIQSLYTCPAAWKSQMFVTNGAPRTQCLFKAEVQAGLDRVALLEAFVRVVFARQRSTQARVAFASILATELPAAAQATLVARTVTPLAAMCGHLTALLTSTVQAVTQKHAVAPEMVFNPSPDPMAGLALIASVVRAPWHLDLRHPADASLVTMLEAARLSEATTARAAETKPTDILRAMTLDTWRMSSVRGGAEMPRPPPAVAVTRVRMVDGDVQTYVDTVGVRRLALSRAIRCAADGDTVDRLTKAHRKHLHVFQLGLSAPETVIFGAAMWPSPGTCPTMKARGGGMRNVLFPQLLADSWRVYNQALGPDDATDAAATDAAATDDTQLALTVFFLLKHRVTRSCPVLVGMVSFAALACVVLDVIEQGGMADPETLCPALTAHVAGHTRGRFRGVCIATPAIILRLAQVVVAVAWVAVRLVKLSHHGDAPTLFTCPTEVAIARVFVHSRTILQRWQTTRRSAEGEDGTVSRMQTALRRLWVGTSAVASIDTSGGSDSGGSDSDSGSSIRLSQVPGTREPMLVHNIIAQARAVGGPQFSVAVSRNVVITPTFTTALFNWVSPDSSSSSSPIAAAKWFLHMVRQPPGVPCPARVEALPRVLASLGGFDVLWKQHGTRLLDAAAEFVSPSLPPSSTGAEHGGAFMDGARRTAAWFKPSSTFRAVTRVAPVSVTGGRRPRSGSFSTTATRAGCCSDGSGGWTVPSGPGMGEATTPLGAPDLLDLLRVAEFARGFMPAIRNTPPTPTFDMASLARCSWPADPDIAAAGLYSPTVFASNITIPPHTGHVSVPFLSYTETAAPETLVTVVPSSVTLASAATTTTTTTTDDEDWLLPSCMGTRHVVSIGGGGGVDDSRTALIPLPLFSGVDDLDTVLDRWHGASHSAVVARFIDSV